MADKVHIVPHFHWDREWYFTAEESKILLVNDMEEVLTMLETREDYPCFVLDGQTSVLEDYFSVSPENRERVRALVQRGKLIIGPCIPRQTRWWWGESPSSATFCTG